MEESLKVECSDVQPELPTGMSVERCRAVLIQVTVPDSDLQIRFRASLLAEIMGHPSTGEGLEAIEWGRADSVVVVGTEDVEALKARMPWLNIANKQVMTSYSPRGIEICLSGTSNAAPSTFHFIIAENPYPEPMSDSAWFAVDMPHQRVVQGF